MTFAPTRRQFGTAIAAAGMAAALPTRFAFAQSEIKLKYGTAFPADHPGTLRIKEAAEGIFATVVNGQVLYDEGKHTGALPGRVLRNTYYHANRG